MGEVTFFDKVKAFLNKVGAYLIDPRIIGMVVAIFLGLRTLGIMQEEVSEAGVSAALRAASDVVFALANMVAILAPIFTWMKNITIRPPRGVTPWLKETAKG